MTCTWQETPTGQRIRTWLGVPVSTDGLTSRSARLRMFEPENPKIFVPRSLGMGWSINIGALAVKLGLIRPDDSLPDLEEYIRPWVAQVLAVVPVMSLGVTLVTAVAVGASAERIVSNWSVTFTPRSEAPASHMALATGALSSVATAWITIQNTAPAGVDVVGSSLVTAVNIAHAALLVAGKNRSRVLAACAVGAIPLVMGGMMVGTVKSALHNISASNPASCSS